MQLLEKNSHMILGGYGYALMRAKGDPLQAVEIAKSLRQSHPHVETISRSAVEAHPLPELPEYRVASASFVGTLSPISAFDALRSSARLLPMRAAVTAVLATMTGSVPGQGGVKPITKLELSGGGIDPQKAVAICVISEEVMRFSPTAAIDFLNGELRVGVAVSTNLQFLADLANGIVAVASSGDFWVDFAAGLSVVAGDRAAKIFAIYPREVVIQLATLHNSDGLPVFPQLRVDGGTIAGVQVLASDELPEDTNGPVSLVVDAHGLALADEPVALRFTRQADIIMDDEPGSGAQNVTSLFQTNSVALLAERYFGSQRLRGSAVHVISGASYSAGT